MDYGPKSSGAFSEDVPKALKDYFRYSRAVAYKEKSGFPSDASWDAMLRGELGNGRPVYYSGAKWVYDEEESIWKLGGHAFVISGYQNNDYFYINWGWGGIDDGYYYLQDNTPLIEYSLYQAAVCPIIPSNVMPEPSIKSVNVPSAINKGDYIEVSVSSENLGATADEGYITISFPSMTASDDDQYVELYSKSSGTTYKEFAKGDYIWHKDGYQIPARFSMVEMAYPSWSNGDNPKIDNNSS